MILTAPLTGWNTALDEVPDAAFADRLLGDGIAVDPTEGVLHAPCSGEIVTVPASSHAVTLRSDCHAEILVHVGIDTVALAGAGFELVARQGERVRAGQPLLRFDLDVVARRARSLLTPIIVLNGARFPIVRRAPAGPVRVGDFLFELGQAAAAAADSTAADPADAVVRHARVAFEHGIHARPAALLVNRTKTFAARLTVQAHGRAANARSVIALMSLGARWGDAVTITASGPDAAAAAAALEAVLAEGDVGASTQAEPARTAAPPRPASARASPGGLTLSGVTACGGVAVGQIVRIVRREVEVREEGDGVARETASLEQALHEVRARLRDVARGDRVAGREIVLAHLEIIDDPELVGAARAWIAKGKSAGFSWRQALRHYRELLGCASDARIAERVDDLLDLESQVLRALDPTETEDVVPLPERAVVVARNLLPSQFAALDARRLAGICLAEGGATSHVAILAAALDVPMLVAAGPAVMDVPEGATVILDADAAQLRVRPDAAALASAQENAAMRSRRRTKERAAAHRDAITLDGERIEVRANVGSLAEARAAVENGAEGCGLLRTEFLFLDRTAPPDESEQSRTYQAIADAFRGLPVTVRLLDVGGDKPIPYLPLPCEANPALGLRGVRVGLWRPELLRSQLRALLRVPMPGGLRILLPMVVAAGEVRTVRTMLQEACVELSATPPLLGAMIETPAAAVTADQLLHEADFVSIGTNDLTQYALAMDRGHPELAARLDGLHPAVLRLIASAAMSALARGRPAAVCGGLAADSAAIPILVGLGVRELSVVPAAVPGVKARIRTLALDACREIARAALDQTSAEAVRSSVRLPDPQVTA